MAVLKVTAFSPATVGNVAVGFDLIGHCIQGIGDEVTAQATPRQTARPTAKIVSLSGVVTDLPTEPQANTASRAVQALLDAVCPPFDVHLSLKKGIPLGSGLGGSAASATAALVATNALLPTPLAQADLYPYALHGESIASGEAVGDNVGPQLLGGLVLATATRLIPLPVPEGLTALVVHSDQSILTHEARQVLEKPFALDAITRQQAGLSGLLIGLYENKMALIAEGLTDHLIEPRRKHTIQGFDEAMATARKAGALGGSISGAGPSVFAWFS
ncbi:MAG TPA: homoserine kinase, partial [Wenzhouxiangella sp.]